MIQDIIETALGFGAGFCIGAAASFVNNWGIWRAYRNLRKRIERLEQTGIEGRTE